MIKSFHFLLLVSVLYFFSLSSIYAVSPLVLTDEFQNYALEDFLEVAEDKNHAWSIEQVSSQEWDSHFRYVDRSTIYFGKTDSAIWLKFKLLNETEDTEWILENMFPFISKLELYFEDNDNEIIQLVNGTKSTLNQTNQRHRFPLFPIELEPGKTKTFYLKITHDQFIFLPFRISTESTFRKVDTWRNLGFGVFFGAMGVSLIVTFFLFLRMRENVYGDYTLLILSAIILSLSINGLAGFLFFPDHLYWGPATFIISTCLYLIFSLRITQSFLNTKSRFPVTHKFINILQVVTLFYIFLPWVPDAKPLGLIVAFISFMTIIIVSYHALRFGGIEMRYFVFARIFPTLGLGLSVLLIFIDRAHDIREYGIFNISYLMEVLLLSMALANQSRQLRNEKFQAQEQALVNLRKADDLKNQLLTNTSHELKTPLHGMIGLLEMILSSSEKISKETTRKLKLIADNAKRLNGMVGKLLDLTALQGNQVEFHVESVYLFPLVDAVLNLTQPMADHKNIHFYNNVPDDLPAVSANPNSLQQILLNLLDNALKYTESGDISVSASQEDEKVRIEITDTGLGIPPEQLEMIFESFKRGENPKVSKQDGLGLGLSICQELVKAHGSKLEVRSVPKEGSVFSFTLPISFSNPKEMSHPIPMESENFKNNYEKNTTTLSELQKKGKSVKQHILVVDDDFTNLEIIFHYLAGQYQITSCDTGQEALNVLESDSHKIDLVLLDVMMPNLDGFEVCELIREKHAHETLPVLLLTALDNEEDIAQGFLAGANDYLVKPFRQAELMARIAAHVSLSSFHRGNGNEESPTKVSVRQNIVKTLQMSLEIWVAETGKGEIDLAQESNIWGTHLDNKTGTYRSRGLQKYLSEVSLPANPRWRKVLKTAQFVLRQCPVQSDSYKKLKEQLDLLTQQLQDTL